MICFMDAIIPAAISSHHVNAPGNFIPSNARQGKAQHRIICHMAWTAQNTIVCFGCEGGGRDGEGGRKGWRGVKYGRGLEEDEASEGNSICFGEGGGSSFASVTSPLPRPFPLPHFALADAAP